MSKRPPRASPTRGTRVAAGGGRPPLDLLRVAAELVANLPDAVVVTGLDGHILTANHAAAELLGRPLDELPRLTMDEIVAPAERAHVTNREQQAFRGQPQRYGTQFFVDEQGRWSLSPVDPAVIVGEGDVVAAPHWAE